MNVLPTKSPAMKLFFCLGWVLLGTLLATPSSVLAHCQMPCGIYDDLARLDSMLEDTATCKKGVTSIAELSGKTDPQSQNQLVRWVTNKEVYAQKIITTTSDYFLTQRVNPKQKDYSERLAKHHAVMVAAMKVKQHAAAEYVDQLKQSIEDLRPYYADSTP